MKAGDTRDVLAVLAVAVVVACACAGVALVALPHVGPSDVALYLAWLRVSGLIGVAILGGFAVVSALFAVAALILRDRT